MIEMRVVKYLSDKGYGFAKESKVGGRIVFFHRSNGVILEPSLISSRPQFSLQKSDRIPQKEDFLIADVYDAKKGLTAKRWGFRDQYSKEEEKLPEFRLIILNETSQQKCWWRNIGCLNDASSDNDIKQMVEGEKEFWFETRSSDHKSTDWETSWKKCEDPR